MAESSTSRLEPFVLLARYAKGKTAAKIIEDATSTVRHLHPSPPGDGALTVDAAWSLCFRRALRISIHSASQLTAPSLRQ